MANPDALDTNPTPEAKMQDPLATNDNGCDDHDVPTNQFTRRVAIFVAALFFLMVVVVFQKTVLMFLLWPYKLLRFVFRSKSFVSQVTNSFSVLLEEMLGLTTHVPSVVYVYPVWSFWVGVFCNTCYFGLLSFLAFKVYSYVRV